MKWKDKLAKVDPKWKTYAMAGCACILFAVVLLNLGKIFGVVFNILNAFSAIIIGAVIAYILNPLAMFFEAKLFYKIKKGKLAWTLAVVLTFILVLAFLSFLISMLVPQMIDNITSLLSNMDKYKVNVENLASRITPAAEEMMESMLNQLTGSDGLLAKAGTYLLENASKFTTAGAKAFNAVIGFIFALYFLLAKTGIQKAFRRLFSLLQSPMRDYQSRMILNKFHDIFSKYIIFELLDALIIGALNCIFMLILKMPNALLITVVVALTNLIPTFGPIIGAAVGVLLLLLVKPACVLPFLIFTLVLQLADSYVIKPRLFGGALNVPGILILISVIVFGKWWGVLGMLIAIPIAGIIVYLYTEMLIPWLELRRDMKSYKKDQPKE